MSLKHKSEPRKNKGRVDIKDVHERGVFIAQKHLTTYLNDLEKTHNYSKLEICAALILISYSVVFGVVKDRMKALVVYRDLSRLSVSLLNGKGKNKNTIH